jgi:hypothetical protein
MGVRIVFAAFLVVLGHTAAPRGAPKAVVKLKVESTEGAKFIHVGKPAEASIRLLGASWGDAPLRWELYLEGELKTSGTVAMSDDGMPQRDIRVPTRGTFEEFTYHDAEDALRMRESDGGELIKKMIFLVLIRNEPEGRIIAKASAGARVSCVPPACMESHRRR